MTMVAQIVVLALLGILVGVGGRRMRRRPGPDGAVATKASALLPASVIVPVAGIAPVQEAALRSLLVQDHADYEILLVTRDPDDPAATLVAQVLRDGSGSAARVRHVVAGPASVCGQKNRNLLAGVREADPNRPILVFCDSTHVTRPDWLSRLVEPIARCLESVTTSYHHILPDDRRLATLGRAHSVLILHFLHEIPSMLQPWGGSMAIRRDVFEALDIARLWETNVVDDVSLAARLRERGVRVSTVLEAGLKTPLKDETFRNWGCWLTRQFLYLKFIFPGAWTALGVLLVVLNILMLQAVAEVVGSALGLRDAGGVAGYGLFLAGLGILGLCTKRLHPWTGSWWRWLVAFFANIVMAGVCHVRTWFVRHIVWQGLRYRVGPGGRVLSVGPGGGCSRNDREGRLTPGSPP